MYERNELFLRKFDSFSLEISFSEFTLLSKFIFLLSNLENFSEINEIFFSLIELLSVGFLFSFVIGLLFVKTELIFLGFFSTKLLSFILLNPLVKSILLSISKFLFFLN